MTLTLRRLAFLAGALALAAAPAVAPAQSLTPVRFSFNPHFLTYAPFFVAIDRGYFKQAGIDLQITTYKTSASGQIPILARGDLDITPVVPGPALFNQFEQGFKIKLVASITEAHPGYVDASVLMVRKDLWDSGAIRKLSDLAAKKVDGAFQGSPVAYLTLSAIQKAGLKTSQVTYTTKEASPADQFAALQNKAVDVQGTTEPTATAIVEKGVAVKWLSYKDVVPGYQDTFLGVSPQFAQAHPEVVQRFLQAWLRGVVDVQRSRGKLTPALVSELAKWSELPPEEIQRIGGVAYSGQMGAINVGSLEHVQKFWMEQGLVHDPVAINQIVETQPLAAARRALSLR